MKNGLKRVYALILTLVVCMAIFPPAMASAASESLIETQTDNGDDFVAEFEGAVEDYNFLEALSNEGSLGIDAFTLVETNPTLNSSNGLSRAGGNLSPATALSLSGYNIRDNVTAIPQGLWYKWTPWNDVNGTSVFNNLYTMYFTAPSNYELLLVNSDLSIIWQIPNNQAFHITFAELASMFNKNPNVITTLDLYLTVQVGSGSISPTKYSLYYGQTYKSGSTGYINTGLSFNFGTQNVPPPQFWYSPAYIYSGMLSNTSVPDQALISEMYLTSDGTGSGIYGGEKFLNTASGFNTSIQGPFDYVSIPKNVHPVKQEYQIQGRLRVSNNHVWKPQLQFYYIYPVIPSNLRFVAEYNV